MKTFKKSPEHLNPAEGEWLVRRRRLYLMAWIFSPLIGFPTAVLISRFGGPVAPLSLVVAAASIVFGTLFGLRLQFARCPRCHHLFYSIPGKWHFMWPTKSCRHCGFSEEHNLGAG